jgi:hypothetical protein
MLGGLAASESVSITTMQARSSAAEAKGARRPDCKCSSLPVACSRLGSVSELNCTMKAFPYGRDGAVTDLSCSAVADFLGSGMFPPVASSMVPNHGGILA